MTMIALALVALTGPVAAQVTTVDPNVAIDGDLKNPRPAPSPVYVAPAPLAADERGTPQDAPPPQDQVATIPPPDVPPTTGPTYDKGDVLSAAEGVFGKGAKGLADILEKILAKQGRPNAYIAGKEASGAFIVGARYGSGTLSHAVSGNQKIYWRGPSIGFDVGGDATKVFVLVYNLYDTEDAFKAYASGEGRLYFVGGFSATYLRHDNIVMIPVRLGVGWRAGVNAGYVKFRHKGTWVPF
ncbi:MAG: EipA family protein [Sphingomonas sp.]